MKKETTFRRWDRQEGTASYKDFFETEVVRRVSINNDNLKRAIVTVKITIKPDCPEVFAVLWPMYGRVSNRTFIGTSTCYKEDEYNEQTGLDIAENKAMQKAYDYIAAVLCRASLLYVALAKDCVDFADIFTNKSSKQEACWKKLGKVQ